MGMLEQKAAAAAVSESLRLQLARVSSDIGAMQQQFDLAGPIVLELLAKINAITADPPEPLTVEDFGAVGDGVTDCTLAFQLAANTGKILVDKSGVYLIDVTKRININLDKTILRITAPNVKFIAKANSAARYYFFDVNASHCDLDFGGAEIYGDRQSHTYTAGSWHEWGYGIFASGENNHIYNFAVYDCTGDGVGLTGRNHWISNFLIRRCRRNGISAFRSSDLIIEDGEITDIGFLTDTTGLPGPFAAIDVEPDKGDARNIIIRRVKMHRNQKAGVALWVRDEVDSHLDVEISDCTITESPNDIWAQDELGRAGTIVAKILRNKLTFIKGAAVKAGPGSVLTVGDTTAANSNTIDSSAGDAAFSKRYGIQGPGVKVVGLNNYI